MKVMSLKRMLFVFIVFTTTSTFIEVPLSESTFVCYSSDLQIEKVKMFYRNKEGIRFSNFKNIDSSLKSNGIELIFAMNGGMFKPDYSPVGLYIENSIMISTIDTSSGEGNFYLKPNGVFMIDLKGQGSITKTENVKSFDSIQYATQSGPMLISDGLINDAFKPESINLNIRNGVGILPNGNMLFVMSKKEINLYNFAAYFENRGCRNALYLDGKVSRTYYPEQKYFPTDCNFGVMIGIVKEN